MGQAVDWAQHELDKLFRFSSSTSSRRRGALVQPRKTAQEKPDALVPESLRERFSKMFRFSTKEKKPHEPEGVRV